MHRLRIKRYLEIPRFDNLRLHAGLVDCFFEPIKGVFGNYQTQFFAHRVFQGVAHRMNAEQPNCFSGARSTGTFFFYDPEWFLFVARGHDVSFFKVRALPRCRAICKLRCHNCAAFICFGVRGTIVIGDFNNHGFDAAKF